MPPGRWQASEMKDSAVSLLSMRQPLVAVGAFKRGLIERGKALNEAKVDHIVALIMGWI